jgi:transcriptional regulator with XRE-family HTH domain
MNQRDSTDFNERVGANVRFYRLARGMSQAEMARVLQDQGFPFQQPTILKVEKGTRPLKFEEAEAIAHILGMETMFLSLPDNGSTDVARHDLQHAMEQIARAETRIAELERELSSWRTEMESAQWAKQNAEARLAGEAGLAVEARITAEGRVTSAPKENTNG